MAFILLIYNYKPSVRTRMASTCLAKSFKKI